MATLAEAVDAAETDWLVSADIPDTVDYLTVESEVVQVTATFPAQYQARDGTTSAPRIRVVRAAGGTTAASHADATALTPLIPPSAGGGAAEAGTVVSDTDPGAIGAGNIWVREYDDTGGVSGEMLYQVNVRNAANDGWLRPQLMTIVGGVLRALIKTDPGATGGDIHVVDASGNEILKIAWGGDGEVDIQNNAADLSWTNKLQMLAGWILMEYSDASGAGSVFLGADEVTLAAYGNRSIKFIGLPTADPGVGNKVWNDAGTLKITADA